MQTLFTEHTALEEDTMAWESEALGLNPRIPAN